MDMVPIQVGELSCPCWERSTATKMDKALLERAYLISFPSAQVIAISIIVAIGIHSSYKDFVSQVG